jgi:integrase
MRAHLTEIAVRALKPVAGKQFKVWDSTTPGFGVLVSERTKSWIVMRSRERKLKVIGRFPSKSLSEARLEARRLLVTPGSGSQPPSPSFLEARDQFLERHGATLRPRSLYQIKRTLTLYFVSEKPLADISHSDVATVIEEIKKPSERAHALKDIKTFFSWCIPRYVAHSPCEGLKKTQQKTRSRVLNQYELIAVSRAAEVCGYPFGPIVQLLILTGQRRGEIGGLRRSWIDADSRTITFPSEITKNGRDHVLPYGEMVATILSALPAVGDLLFPARGNSEKTFSGYSPSKERLDKLIVRRNGKSPVAAWTLHDLRRTFATNLAALGVRLEVTEKLLNHVSGSLGGIVAVYQRHDYMDEMRQAMETWEARLAALLKVK